MAARMAAVDSTRRADDSPPARPVLDYFRRNFHVDTVSDTPGSIRMAQGLYGPQKLVFASDHPWLPREAAFQSLDDQLDEDERRSLVHTVLPGITTKGSFDER